jgi:HPt (histidine-containing phosphotransfer) domain-containing protein
LVLADLAQALPRWMPVSDKTEVVKSTLIAEEKAPVTITAEAVPVWDEAATLKRVDGDVDLLEELKALFAIEAPKLLAALDYPDGTPKDAAISQAIAVTAHTLKGMAGNFYAKPLVEVCMQVERKGRSDEGISYDDPLIQQMREELERVTQALSI